MAEIIIPNVRETSDITVKVRLKYSGVPIDWTGIRDIRALIYSDEQKAIAGRCSTSIDEEDNTILVCDYAATKPQYRGVNRIIVQGKYYDRTNTYDKPAFNIVAQNSDLTEQEAVIVDTSAEESVEVDVSIEITQVSTSLLDNAIAAAINAADHAEHAASLVPLEVLQECEGATEAANKAADLANEKAHLANEKAHLADSAASFANEKATLAAEKAEVADTKATLANEAAQRAESAAEHQVPYIGDNGNWFRWDNEAGEYLDTGEKAQGPQGIQGEPAVATENYVIAEATPETTDVADLLPVVGSADTLYRVACWDGTQYDTTVYSVYGWYNGAYKLLEKKQPGIDDEPTANSQNLVKSGGVAAKISQLGQQISDFDQEIERIDYELEHESWPNYVNDSKISMAGTVVTNSGTIASDFVPYVSGSSVLWVYGGAMWQAFICFYDENKSFISGAYWSGGSGTQLSISASDIQNYAPNARYLRASFIAGYSDASISMDGTTVWVPSSGGRGGIIPSLEELEQKVEDLDIDAINTEIQNINYEIEHTGLNYIQDKNVNQSGNLVDRSGVIASEFIPYSSGNSVLWKFGSGLTAIGNICFYDENKSFINDAYWQALQGTERTITAADIERYAPNARYLRASFVADYADASITIGSNVWTPGTVTDGLKPRVEKLEEDFNELKNGIVDTIPPAMSAIASKTGLQAHKKLHNYFCFVHQSDIHSDVVRMQRMINFANRYTDRIDCIISTGDFEATYGDGGGFDSTYVATLPSCRVLHFPVIGNHDVGNSLSLSAETPAQTAARMITPYMAQLGAVQGGTDTGYYYRDFSDHKIRLIVLNEYEMPRIPNAQNTQLKYGIWQRYLSQTQANWLVQTLLSMQSGWTVVIAMHQPIDPFTKYDNEFKGTVPYAHDDSVDSQNGMLQDIIDAFIGRTTLQKSFPVANATPSEVPTVTIDANFSTAQGVFSCYINGHTHNDGTGQSARATEKQVDLNITCGNIAYAYWDDLYREDGAPAQDAYNVICVDTDRKELRMHRIGATVNNQMKRREYACISYAQE